MRRIHLSGPKGKEVWQYSVGKRDGVVIRDPKGRKYVACFCCVTGFSWAYIERAKHKKYFRVLPSSVKRFIEDRLHYWHGYAPGSKCTFCRP